VNIYFPNSVHSIGSPYLPQMAKGEPKIEFDNKKADLSGMLCPLNLRQSV